MSKIHFNISYKIIDIYLEKSLLKIPHTLLILINKNISL